MAAYGTELGRVGSYMKLPWIGWWTRARLNLLIRSSSFDMVDWIHLLKFDLSKIKFTCSFDHQYKCYFTLEEKAFSCMHLTFLL